MKSCPLTAFPLLALQTSCSPQAALLPCSREPLRKWGCVNGLSGAAQDQIHQAALWTSKGALCSNEGSNLIHAIEGCSLQGAFTTVLPFFHNYSRRRKHVFRITFLQWESAVFLQVVQLSPCVLVSWESAGWGSWSCPAAQAGEQSQPCSLLPGSLFVTWINKCSASFKSTVKHLCIS